ncbi:MAG: succinate dehydrogenase assembly factor 2 [Cellvibrionaceae bacterium]
MHINKVLWACRRGMLELDLVLLPFVENIYPSISDDDKQRFWALLDQEDQDLFVWFMKREDPEDKELFKIVDIIRKNTGLQPEDLTSDNG